MKKLRIVALLLSILLLAACSGEVPSQKGSVTKISFKAASGYDYLKTIKDTQVEITGYMATSSPVDGSFMFLMNLPYQSCPFCVPNTSQLSNTMEVYPKSGETFPYTAQAIKVTGTLKVADNADQPFTDNYGYEFNYKIVDAEYTILQAEELSEDMVLWQKFANADIVTDLYKMYDYVNFLCKWNTYTVNTYTDEQGNEVKGYYLYAADAMNFITMEGAQFNYGYQEDYFERLIARIQEVDPTAFDALVKNVEKAKALAQKAFKELEDGNYSMEKQYVEQFDTEDYIYTINIGEELSTQMDTLYAEFANWLSSWEM